jgi:hypothetical protein
VTELIFFGIGLLLGAGSTSMFWAKNVFTARRDVRFLDTQLALAIRSLGGRVPTKPIYVMPPGQPNTASCDDARMAWMDAAERGARTLRALGCGEVADAIYPHREASHQE